MTSVGKHRQRSGDMFEGTGLEQMKKHVAEEQVVKQKTEDGGTGCTPTADLLDAAEVEEIKKGECQSTH